MKKITTIGLAFLLLAGGALAKSKLILDKTFGLAENEKIEVLAYQVSPEDGQKTVKIKTDAGISIRPLDSFPAAAQKEILAWAADETFESSSGLRVRIKENEERHSVDTQRGTVKTTGDIEEITYTVELENRGDVVLEGVKLDAIIFYEKHHDDLESKHKISSSATLDILPGKKETFKSRTVEIRDQIIKHDPPPRAPPGFGIPPSEYIEDELNGMVLVLTRKDRKGKLVTREFKDGRPPKPKEQSEYEDQAQPSR